MSSVNAENPAFLFLSVTIDIVAEFDVVSRFNVLRYPLKEKGPSQGDL